MLFLLRCVGVINAAIWFGATFFLCIVLGPSFTSDQMLSILPPSHSGRALQIVLERDFVLQCWCGGIALVHLLVEWLYTGKPLRPWAAYLVLGLLGLALVRGFWLEPKVKRLHLDVYGMRSTPQQREHARVPLKVWGDVAGIMRVLLACGLLAHLLQVSSTESSSRFLLGAAKFKG
ncbi:MAG: DUF4149 domain-containing protein [Verrucomicrobia bacterium]|nr:DUF4149 domain-containing protein [Verrucomicrobiota bacterium]